MTQLKALIPALFRIAFLMSVTTRNPNLKAMTNGEENHDALTYNIPQAGPALRSL